jgi:DNA-binding SARP family transcriptional activator
MTEWLPLRFGLLGPVVVWSADPEKDHLLEKELSENKVRSALAALLLRPNQFVTQAQLIQLMWDEPPESARPNIRSYVARVRKLLQLADAGADRLSSLRRGCGADGGAYRLAVEPMELDAEVFTTLLRQAGEQCDRGFPCEAAALLRRALSLWRGDAGRADLTASAAMLSQLEALNQLRLVAQEDLVSVRLQMGEHRLVVPEIRALLSEHQVRESLWAQLMRAFYRSGDVGAALRAYEESWQVLDRQLGVQPGSMLRQLHASILRRDDESV